MQEETIFRPGRDVRVTWSDPEDRETEYSVTLRVVTKDANSLFLSFPKNSQDYPIQRRTEVSVFVLLENDDVEEYSTIFEGVEDELSMFPMWALRYPMFRVAVMRKNKRQHFRLDLREPFYYCRMLEERMIPSSYPYQGEMLNLSGGGLRGYAPSRLEMGETLEVMLNLAPHRIILRAEVVNLKPLKVTAKYVAEIALRFFAYEGENHEELLVRYIMQEQIKRKTLL